MSKEIVEKNKGGRPLKYQTPEQMQKAIDLYFNQCDKTDTPYTITGLALSLDMDRKGLILYAEKGEFSNTVKQAKARVENDYELSLRRRGNAGDIFGLKNFGWTDQREVTTRQAPPIIADTIPLEDIDGVYQVSDDSE